MFNFFFGGDFFFLFILLFLSLSHFALLTFTFLDETHQIAGSLCVCVTDIDVVFAKEKTGTINTCLDITVTVYFFAQVGSTTCVDPKCWS